MRYILFFLLSIHSFFSTAESPKEMPLELFAYFLNATAVDSETYPMWKQYINSLSSKDQTAARSVLKKLFEKDFNYRLRERDLELVTFEQNKIPNIEEYFQNEVNELRAAYIDFGVKLVLSKDAPEPRREKFADDVMSLRIKGSEKYLKMFLPENYIVDTFGDLKVRSSQHKDGVKEFHDKRMMILFNEPMLAESAIDDNECLNNIKNPDIILKAWCFDESLRTEVRKIAKLIDPIPYKKNSFYDFYADNFRESCSKNKQTRECILDHAKNTLSHALEDSKNTKKEIDDLIKLKPDRNKSKPLLDSIAGVYKPKFQITVFNPDGDELLDVEDIYEIAPIDDVAAYVKIKTVTTNGHTCGMQGIFKYTDSKSFSFIDTSNEPFQGICRMKMSIEEDHIKFVDPDNACKQQSCGARAAYDGAEVPLSLKRKIKYMDILKNSEEFKKAIDEYSQLKNNNEI